MTIEELNKLIKEELNAFFEAEDDDMDAGDDIEVTTDEPAVEDGDEALDTLRQIFNMLKPLVEPEEEEEVMDLEDEDLEDEETEEEEIADGEDDEEGVDEAVGYPNYKADQVQKVKADASDVNQGLNESVEKEAPNTVADRFQKLANIQK
tara:strand:+ start:1120 stop:1569 length:450 start_codon:yes stop_codon:yes gene_type:complete